MQFSAPKGTNDILASHTPLWRYVEGKFHEIASLFGFQEIRTPMFENAGLFSRGVGEGTDIVTKEMFTFSHSQKEMFALRPEGTAAVVRSYIENGMSSEPKPVKLYYIENMFRAENPQKGRSRQFTQFGIETLGSASASTDAETISVCAFALRQFGISNVELNINSVGCPVCRKAYYEKLSVFLESRLDSMCPDCRSRAAKNPMRVLDCKQEACQAATAGAPLMLDNLCNDCASHFEELQHCLAASKIEFSVNPRIVRGLDYYTKTAFEFLTNDLGSQSAVCAGGRYDGLAETIGGKPTPGVGFGFGIERLLLLMEAQGVLPNLGARQTGVFFASLDSQSARDALGYAMECRSKGIAALTDTLSRSLKAQMKYADKLNSRYVIFLEAEKTSQGIATVRDMETKEQFDIDLSGIASLFDK